MELQHLQTNLLSLIKSRECELALSDNYLSCVAASDNLKFIRKSALWWRRIQIEKYCPLTTNLLKASEKFELEVSDFFTECNYSIFREEVGIQFLEFIISKNLNALQQCVSEFELSVIQLKLGKKIVYKKEWLFEPYAIISALIKNSFTADSLTSGKFVVGVSYKYKKNLFNVKKIKN